MTVDPGIQFGGNPNLGAANPSGWGTGTATQSNAFDTLRDLLAQYGLSSLTDWAWAQLTGGRSAGEIALDLPNQQAYKDRFPAISQREEAGLPALSPAEYIAYENQATQMMRAAGFPPAFYDQPDDFTKLISRDVSLSEFSQRVSLYQRAVYQQPKETRDEMKRLYGISEGDMAAVLADPDRALPIIQQQIDSSIIAGEAQRQRFGALTQTEAERLAALGISDQQAAQGFGQVTQASELFQRLPGEVAGGPGREQALGLVAGDASSLAAIDAQARRRKGEFAGGGGYASTQTGLTGLGSAAS